MLSEKSTIIIVWLLFFFEIIPTVVYIYNYGEVFSSDENDNFLSDYKYELKNKVINPYYYMYEFERIFPHNNYESYFSEVVRSDKFNFINYFYLVNILLWLFSVCIFYGYYYDTLFVFLVILEILTLVGFINTLFLFQTNVNIPGINIYIFDDSFNDRIRKRFETLYDIKVNCSIAEFILLILFAIQMVCIKILGKYEKERDILSKSINLKRDEINGNLLE